jgi:hypothetical protein
MALDAKTKLEMDAIFEKTTGVKPSGGLPPIQERIAQLKGVETKGSDLKSDIKQTGQGIKGVFEKRSGKIQESIEAAKKGEQTVGEAVAQSAVQFVRTPFDIAGELIKGGVKGLLSQEQEEKLKVGVGEVAGKAIETVSDLTSKYENLKEKNPTLAGGINIILGYAPEAAVGGKDLYEKYQELKETNPRAARNMEAVFGVAETALDLATLGTGKVATTALKETGEQAIKAGVKAGGRAVETVVGGASKVKKLAVEGVDLAKKKIAPKELTPEQAVGQVIQGKSTDIIKAQKAIESIDTKGVETYKDLAGKLQEKKKDLISTVDNELSKDATVYPIDQLVTKSTTKSGKDITVNYVEKSLNDLKEFYKTVGDAVKESEIDDLISKKAFTRKEVNDISRIYNEEFGSKAFSKLGDPLTSVNAQAYENTRKGLKDVARQGIGGSEAKLADSTLSAIYNTEKLVKRNIEAVNKLKQRINERGLLEKAGHFVSKYGDILTGGTIRGLIGGLLPRGAGYKILNALDLEDQLKKNLEIINKSLNAKNDDMMIKNLKKLKVSSNNKD